MLTSLPSEQIGVVATIDPDVLTAAAHNSDGVDMSKWHQAMVILLLGDLGTSGTVDLVITSGSDNSTFGNTVKTATQLTQAGTDSDKQVIINVLPEDLVEGDRYIRAELTVGTASSDGGLVILGIGPRNGSATDNDLSTVDEVLTT